MRVGPAFALIAALVLATCSRQPPHGAEVMRWRIDAPWFGGFSGLWIAPDGSRMIALSDRGTLVSTRIDRADGRIVAIRDVRPVRMRASSGKPLLNELTDGEGLAITPDGTIHVSYEQVHRVARYETPGGAAQILPRPAAFDAFDDNRGLEALASDDQGRLYALPEDWLTPEGAIPVFRWDGQAWTTPFTLPKRGGFLPVGADFGPDGRFYLLERDLGMTGFRNRLRSWDLTGDTPRDEITLIDVAGVHDNLEGVSVWRDSSGRLRATMISDDNFLPLQRTEIVEYMLKEKLAERL